MLSLVDIISNFIIRKKIPYTGIIPDDLCEKLNIKHQTLFYCIKPPLISNELIKRKILNLCDAIDNIYVGNISSELPDGTDASEYLYLSIKRFLVVQMFSLSVKYNKIESYQVNEMSKNTYELLLLLSDAYSYDNDIRSRIENLAFDMGYPRIISRYPYPDLMYVPLGMS